MYFTPYVKHDGYYESICSLKEGLGPILKCRVVLRADGLYDSIVRDFATGKMVASHQMIIIELAKDTAQNLAKMFIKSELDF